jgi:hypothetical protein
VASCIGGGGRYLGDGVDCSTGCRKNDVVLPRFAR